MHSCNLYCKPQCLYTFHTHPHDRRRFGPGLLGLASLGRTLCLGFVCLSREQSLGSELLLGLVIAVGDQPIEEAVRAASVVALSLCALDLAVEVAGGLLIDVVLAVVLVKVGWAIVSSPSLHKTTCKPFGTMRPYRSCHAWKACASASL
jgi:hypothetical protein